MKKWICLLGVLVAWGAGGQSDIMPRPPKPAPTGNELAQMIHDTRVGRPQTYRHLAVYPLLTRGAGGRGYVTLDDAIARAVLVVTEKGGGNVPELLVENRGDEPIFLLAGQIVNGGKQNRVIAQDVLLAPRSGPISLGVFCVEQGRWVRQTDQFDGEKEMAHSNLRQQLNAPGASQRGVWDEVGRKASAVAPSAAGGTRYVGKVYEDKDVKESVDDYLKNVQLPGDANGMAVVLAGRVVGVELFGDTETFGKLRDKLLRSYAMDALEYKDAGKVAERRVVEQFLRRAEDVRLVARESVGIGQFFKVEGGHLYGSVLVWRDQPGRQAVAHASLFDDSPVIGK